MSNQTPVTPLIYIRQQMKELDNNFAAEWGKLTDQDKRDLRQWAEEEMKHLSIPIKGQ